MHDRKQLTYSLIVLVLYGVSPLIACDYTVRDIGFVKLGGPDFSMYVVGPEAAEYSADDTRTLDNWNIRLLATSSEQIASYPEAIRKSSDFEPTGWSMWLVDAAQRALHLESASQWDQLPSIEQTIARHLNSKRLREVSDEALRSFAQVVLFDCAAASKLEIARQTASSVARLEPLLPRPILLPVRTILISEEEREAERVFLWALGIDAVSSNEAVMTVLYGCGRLAGPALCGEEIRLEESIAQLALVGESCECETDRSWYNESRLPVFWDKARERQAAQALSFDPSNSRIRAEVQQILSRGSRGTSSFPAGDQIDRLVDGYFESNVVGREPQLLPIPAGRKSPEVSSQVIAGEGWDFDSTNDEQPGHNPAQKMEPIAAMESYVPIASDSEDPITWIPLLAAGFILFAAVVLGRTILRKPA